MDDLADPRAYYEKLGAIAHPQTYWAEFWEFFSQNTAQAQHPNAQALEIGAGTSPYMRMLWDLGYQYTAIEPSQYACDWMRQQAELAGKAITCFQQDWEKIEVVPQYDLILSAHALEHMGDAPWAVQKMADALKPGGLLYLIIPDDTDKYNPDHWWFFNRVTLENTLRAAGLVVVSTDEAQRTERESFLYACARKPDQNPPEDLQPAQKSTLREWLATYAPCIAKVIADFNLQQVRVSSRDFRVGLLFQLEAGSATQEIEACCDLFDRATDASLPNWPYKVVDLVNYPFVPPVDADVWYGVDELIPLKS